MAGLVLGARRAQSLLLAAHSAFHSTRRLKHPPLPAERFVQISDEVREAVKTGRPVIALETTIYTHGMSHLRSKHLCKFADLTLTRTRLPLSGECSPCFASRTLG